MPHDDDRELRRRVDREASTLLHDHKERMQPPPGAAEASWSALQARIAAGEPAPTRIDERPPGRRPWRAVLVTALAAAAVLALWRQGPGAARQSGDDRGLAAIFQKIDPDGSRRAAARVAPSPAPPADSRERAPHPAVPEDISPVPGDSKGDLARELAQVRAAGEAARAGRGQEALVAAEAYLRAHPRGTFAPEARLHRAEGLCLVGRVDEAREAAESFVRELPDSPLRARMSAVCGEQK